MSEHTAEIDAAPSVTAQAAHHAFHEVWTPGDTHALDLYVTSPLWQAIAAAVEVAALRQYASDLDWRRPEKCPCENPEACCGSEASCDAMQPVRYIVGVADLRARADKIEQRILPGEAHP